MALASRRGLNADDYWKIPRHDGLLIKQMQEMLQQRGYSIRKGAGKEALQTALRRSELGLPSYHNMTNDELRACIKARGIDASTVINGKNRGSGPDLRSLLQIADRTPKFEKFTDLPPELRNRIYGYYFDEFSDKHLDAPTQPPITMVCRSLRHETLHMFYSSCLFRLRINWDQPYYLSRTMRLRLGQQDSLFLHCNSNESIARIRRLWLHAHHQIKVMVTIPEEGSEYTIYARDSTDNPSNESRDAAVRAELTMVMDGIVARPGKWRLRKEDVFEMRRAIETAFNHYWER